MFVYIRWNYFIKFYFGITENKQFLPLIGNKRFEFKFYFGLNENYGKFYFALNGTSRFYSEFEIILDYAKITENFILR